MGYRDDLDEQFVLKDPIDHPVLSSARRVQGIERRFELFAQPMWIVDERAGDELERRGRNLLWQCTGECPPSRPGKT
jgi:hypothetical protein